MIIMNNLTDNSIATVKQEVDENRLSIKDEVKIESELLISSDENTSRNFDEYGYEDNPVASYGRIISEITRTDLSEITDANFGGSKCNERKIIRIRKMKGRLEKKKRKSTVNKREQIAITVSSSQENNLFCCNICNKFFTFKQNLIKHTKNVHFSTQEVFRCDKCGKTYKHLDSLKDHKRIYKKFIKCDFCDYVSSSSTCLRRHVICKHIKHHRKDFMCKTCEKSFPTVYHLKDHERRHGSGNGLNQNFKNFICDICNKSFLSKKEITHHIKMHIGMKDFVCLTCKRAFITKFHLIRHEQSKFHKKRLSLQNEIK